MLKDPVYVVLLGVELKQNVKKGVCAGGSIKEVDELL